MNGLVQTKKVTFPGTMSWDKGTFLKEDPEEKIGFGWHRRGYPLEELTSWKSNDLDNITSCLPRIERKMM